MKTNILALLLFLTFASCITLKESKLNLPKPETISSGPCQFSSPGGIYMNIFGIIRSNFLPAAIKIKTDSLLVYSDPQLFAKDRPADYIFITHNHYDHFSKKEIASLSNNKTVVIGPRTVTRKLKNLRTKTVAVGDSMDLGILQCKVVDSYNVVSNLHKKGSDYLGYVLTIKGTRIYIPGDTDFIPEMEELKDIDVAFLPIGEGKTAMGPEAAARAASTIKPGMVVPIHYKVAKGREKEFSEQLDKNIPLHFFQEPINQKKK